jgi:glycine/sarcosine N-methyltransferase
VTAVDLSEEMLEKLRGHAVVEGRLITTMRASFQELQRTLKTSFDGVFCMGNALAHLLTAEDLRLALDKFSALLKPGGLLVIQVLNFERILAQRPRVLSVKTSGNTVYTRSYEYADPLIQFNIAKSKEGNVQPDEVITTTLRPVLWKELSFMLGDVGFENVKCFGSISMTEYAPATSQDLLVLASRKIGASH